MSGLTPRLKVKDPQEALVYAIDWGARWLAPEVTINSSTWTITGPDAALIKDAEVLSEDERSTRVRLSAGTNGAKYVVTNRIVTNESPSQTGERSFMLLVQE
jgi:hypothetical protein